MLLSTKASLCLIGTVLLGAAVYAQRPHPQPLSRQNGRGEISFNRDIRPILAENCFACHGPDRNKRQAELRLDDPASALRPRILVAGHPEKSALVQRINSSDPSRAMPPLASTKKLTAAQRALIARWIKEGAKYQSHWSYIPPQRPPVPAIQNPKSKIQNPIDSFILAELQKRRIEPSPQADRRTLIRRVYLDLTGIPPSPKEVADFLADRSPTAYEKIVDRLLASPRYGERMATPWLDIVRYADTVGYHGDQNFNAWAYRDYVIKSFNENKPFDRFTLEQIAGDLLPTPTPEMLTATCFNRLNMMTREGGAQPKEYLAKYAADRVRTVSMAFLGSTMGCCECHDHKYDPFKQKDFYSLAAFFADVKQWGVYQDYDYTPNPDLKGWSNDHPWPPEIEVESEYLKGRIAADRARIREIAARTEKDNPRLVQDMGGWRIQLSSLLEKHPDGWLPALEHHVSGVGGTAQVADLDVVGVDGKRPEGKTYGTPQPDNSLLISADAPQDLGILLPSRKGWVASVKLDLLPSAQYNGSVLRQGAGGFLRVGLSLHRVDGKLQPLGVRYGSADHYSKRYYNGFDLLGVKDGWQLEGNRLKEENHSIWTLDKPIKLAEGERILITLKGAKVGSVRVASSPLSPYVPDDPMSLNIPKGTAEAIEGLSNKEQLALALEAYLRGTAWQPQAFAQLKKLEADMVECRRGITPVMVVQSVKPMTVRVLPRGNWQDESGPIVEPAVPGFLPHASLPTGRRLTRLDLAKWLTSKENPLTSRMFVNRLWKQFFGTALSDKVEDLGTQGEMPSHPELLDWLACEFIQPTTDEGRRTTDRILVSGRRKSDPGEPSVVSRRPSAWDVKHIVRLIVTSATYKQSSRPRADLAAIDPNNRLYAAQNPRRLEAELVRDNALTIAGLINFDVGGPPCKPYQPALYYANLQFPDREYQPDDDDRQWRRTAYSHWQRTFLHPMLANFDAPSREDCIAARTAANTPQQALTLLNDPEFVEASRAFAARLLAAPGSDAERLGRAFEMALARPIKPEEKRSLLAFLENVRKEYRARPEDATKVLKVGISPATQGDALEAAAWASVCRVILNLHETITRY